VSDRPAAATPLRTALVAFDAGGAATTCALDGGRAVACASPFGVLGLRPGAHRLVIAAGGHSALVAWSVVAPRRGGRPRVAFVDRPRGGGSSALFTWDSTAAARTTCTLDGRSARCASPRVLTRLRAGTHRFRVTVANAHGSARTAFTWTVGGGGVVAGSGPSCGARRAGPGTYAHVVWIVMENHGYADVLDPGNAPYTAALAGACGSATDFHAETHPSLPNYVAMTSGGTQGVTDDADPSKHELGVPSIFSLVGDWRSLEEAMPSPCALTSSGTYAVRHNPAAYYTGIRGACATRDVPLAATPDLSARFTFVTPDLCHDTHDCSVRTGDDWLAGFLPKVFASSEYRSGTTAVFLTWDENDGGGGNQIALLAIAPSVPKGRRVAVTANHYALLRTTEELLGVTPLLGNAASAPSLRAAFNF
jgi:phosphatidylinositol-3-phosphatase